MYRVKLKIKRQIHPTQSYFVTRITQIQVMDENGKFVKSAPFTSNNLDALENVVFEIDNFDLKRKSFELAKAE